MSAISIEMMDYDLRSSQGWHGVAGIARAMSFTASESMPRVLLGGYRHCKTPADTALRNLTRESWDMLRWIFRLIAIAVIGKFLNQYLASRAPQLRRQEVP